ncbi:MAG TPA: hypothetical protein VFA89_07935 [Terriglobales bacterium]|nr:hypothetical protein [Terriglobales bacterium]
MFEQELEMETKQGSVVPLLLIVALIVAIAGMAVYYLLQAREVLTQEQATPQVAASMAALGPVTTHFAVGLVKASVAEKPHDPNYRLMEKAGLIKIGKDQGWKTPVQLTDKGKSWLSEIKGIGQSKDKDGTDLYVVPLAERKLMNITKITMTGTGHANVEFTWKWETNKMGDLFDASGTMVKSFNTWDRSTLIDHYGANFYHNEPTKAVLAFAKGDKGWQIAPEY